MAWLVYAPYMALSVVYCADAWRSGRLSRWLKPLLMPVLLAAYALSAGQVDALVALGLALGWVGDCALMLPRERHGDGPLLAGLGAFLLGHVMYIARFVRLLAGGFPGWAALYLLPLMCVGVALYRALLPGLGALRPAVVAYEAVILLMSACAFAVMCAAPGTAGVCAWVGSACFIASDALLAMGMFIGERPHGHFWVMALYTLAQMLIALSATLAIAP